MALSTVKQKAAIIIDGWKKEIFTRHLTQAGYDFEEYPGITTGTRMLEVYTTNMEALAVVVKAANTEAAQTGEQK